MTMEIPFRYYRHHNTPESGPGTEAGFGGWQSGSFAFDPARLALVSMHAWHPRTPDAFPGAWRAHPYFHRTRTILKTVYPPLLAAARAAGVPVFHVVGGGDYFRGLPGYQRAKALAAESEPDSPRDGVPVDETLEALRAFRRDQVYPGAANREDVGRFHAALDFADEARPEGDEGVAENGGQLTALCREAGVNHLLYCGFAVNWCLLLSPGGMADAQRSGALCSIVADATTAIENRETAPGGGAKALALWRIALAYGFVFESRDLIAAFQTG